MAIMEEAYVDRGLVVQTRVGRGPVYMSGSRRPCAEDEHVAVVVFDKRDQRSRGKRYAGTGESEAAAWEMGAAGRALELRLVSMRA